VSPSPSERRPAPAYLCRLVSGAVAVLAVTGCAGVSEIEEEWTISEASATDAADSSEPDADTAFRSAGASFLGRVRSVSNTMWVEPSGVPHQPNGSARRDSWIWTQYAFDVMDGEGAWVCGSVGYVHGQRD
jgi:hypothetical protein